MLTALNAHNLTKHFKHVISETDMLILSACNKGEYSAKIEDEELLMKIMSCIDEFIKHYTTAGYVVDFAMGHNTLDWSCVRIDSPAQPPCIPHK